MRWVYLVVLYAGVGAPLATAAENCSTFDTRHAAEREIRSQASGLMTTAQNQLLVAQADLLIAQTELGKLRRQQDLTTRVQAQLTASTSLLERLIVLVKIARQNDARLNAIENELTERLRSSPQMRLSGALKALLAAEDSPTTTHQALQALIDYSEVQESANAQWDAELTAILREARTPLALESLMLAYHAQAVSSGTVAREIQSEVAANAISIANAEREEKRLMALVAQYVDEFNRQRERIAQSLRDDAAISAQASGCRSNVVDPSQRRNIGMRT